MDANVAPVAVFVSIVTSIIGSVIVVLAVLWVIERQRRPKLWFQIEKPSHQLKVEGLDAELLRLYVHNRRMPRWLSWVYDREPALMCRAWIAFYDLNRVRVYSREMMGRWAETPNPVIGQVPGQSGTPMTITLNAEYLRNWVDIPPGLYTPLDLAVRCKGESSCYGWNNDSHQHQGKNPDWQLKEGQFIVRVTIKAGGRNFDAFFQLINEMEFRLVEAKVKGINDHMN